jgi:hypothetical protein
MTANRRFEGEFYNVAAELTRTYLTNALGSPKSLKKWPFRQGQTTYEMASTYFVKDIYSTCGCEKVPSLDPRSSSHASVNV